MKSLPVKLTVVMVFLGLTIFGGRIFAGPKDSNEAGFALLEELVGSFAEMAETGSGGYETVNSALQTRMAQLNTAWEQNRIDGIFYRRYRRLLVAIKLVIMNPDYDKEGILDEHITDFLTELADNSFDWFASLNIVSIEFEKWRRIKSRPTASVGENKRSLWGVDELHRN